MASFFQRFNIDDNQITETAKNKHKRLDCQTLQFFHVQIHCACQCIMTLPPKILWPTALLNTWTIITFPKSSFYHTNHTFVTSVNVWMTDFWSINARIKKKSSAQNTILCEWLLQKLPLHHNEITIFQHSQYPTQRTFGEPPAPSVYIYIHISLGIQSPCQRMIGVSNHLRNAKYLDSITILRFGEPGSLGDGFGSGFGSVVSYFGVCQLTFHSKIFQGQNANLRGLKRLLTYHTGSMGLVPYIYLHLPAFTIKINHSCIGKYTSPMDPMG